MRVSLRLLFTLAFVVLILPKIVTWYWNSGPGRTKELVQQHQDAVDEYGEAATARKDGLVNSLGELRIEDPAFEKCVATNMEKYHGVIGKSGIDHAAEVTTLLCDRRGITSLNGIENMRNLTSVSFRDNNIRDLNPLGPLSKLVDVDLSGNTHLENVDALLEIQGLKRVSITDQEEVFCYEIESVLKRVKENLLPNDVSPLRGFKNLKCRGRDNPNTKKLVLKRQRGESLTFEEQQIVDDYEFNESSRF